MDNDYCIVTGANAGIGRISPLQSLTASQDSSAGQSSITWCYPLHIGKEVTAGLLARGANVVMACRWVLSICLLMHACCSCPVANIDK